MVVDEAANYHSRDESIDTTGKAERWDPSSEVTVKSDSGTVY